MRAAAHDPPPAIDWVPAVDFHDDLPGRVGMTVLPGKHGPSIRYPGRVYRGDLNGDLSALRAAGVVRLILLVDDDELRRWGDPEIVGRAAGIGLPIQRHPMPDGGTPPNELAMRVIVRSVRAARGEGDVAVACMGGVGRSGTVVACALVAAGWEPDDAIRRVRAIRHPTAVETRAQEAFVRKFHLGGGGPAAKVAR